MAMSAQGGEPRRSLCFYGRVGGVSPFPLKKSWARPIPRRRNRRVPLPWGAADMEVDSARRGPRVPVHCFGPGPTALGTVCGPGPGAPVGVLR